MKYYKKLVKITMTLVIILLFSNYSYAMPYYDLRFEEIETKVIKGEYENLIEVMNLDYDSNKLTLMNKTYKTKTTKTLTKDEEDAITQVLNQNWRKEVIFKGTKYVKLRPVYKEVKGYLVKDYDSFERKEELKILIPLELEYSLDTSKSV